MSDLTEIRYLYARNRTYAEVIQFGSGRWYGCLLAVSMKDAKDYLPKGTLIKKVRLDYDAATFLERSGQDDKKASFECAIAKEDVNALVHGMMEGGL